jgi:hypothetical protein
MADRAMLALAIIAFVLCVVAIAAAFTEFHPFPLHLAQVPGL